MRRFPVYAHPNPPHSFYASPAEATSYHHPHRSFSPSSIPAPRPTPTRRSIINVPVFDSAPSRPSSSPPSQPHPPAVCPPIDPSSAATTIQSHFRGFCVRRHHPLLHLRSIAKARKQLEELQSELEKPAYALKLRKSENERLRFSESVMAIILLLDAVEGSIAEVRGQRKEATKMAIKLQDAIMMQKDEIAALNPTTDGMAPSDEAVQPQEPHFPEVNMVQGEAYTVSAHRIMDVNAMQEKPLSPEVKVAEKYMPHVDNNDVMDMEPESISLLHPCEVEDLDQERSGIRPL